MTEAVMFGPDGNNLLPARVLYKKNILAIRGSFRPVTNVNMDMFTSSSSLFYQDEDVEENNTMNIFEITLSNLRSNGTGFIDEQDFMDRAKLLCAMGLTVMISNFKEYYRFGVFFKLHHKKDTFEYGYQ